MDLIIAACEAYDKAITQLYKDINDMLDRMIKETEVKLIDPAPYVEQFRLFNESECKTLLTCAKRGRIPPKDTHLVLNQTVSTDTLYVSYSCTEYGLTQCLILAKGSYNKTFLFTGFARLNPIDSYNRKKGESLAFYRALTQSEAIILPVLSESLFASAV